MADKGLELEKAGILAAVTFLLGSKILALALIPIVRARGASAICRSGESSCRFAIVASLNIVSTILRKML